MKEKNTPETDKSKKNSTSSAQTGKKEGAKNTPDTNNKQSKYSVPVAKEQPEDTMEKNFVEQKVDSFTVPVNNMKAQCSAAMNNPDASASEKAVAVGLAVVDAGMAVNNALKSIKGLTTGLADKAVVSMLGKLTFLRGIACLPIVKQMDPVLGVDVHFVNIPPSPAPVPMPHPYIGIMFEPKDFVSCALLFVAAQFTPPPPPPDAGQGAANKAKFHSMAHQFIVGKIKNMGASVKIGPFIPRVTVTTPSMPVPHIPMGAGFHPSFAWVKKSCGYSYLGSLFVNADGNPLTGGFAHLHNDCWDVGMPPVEKLLAEAFARMFRMAPPASPKPPVELYLPTGVMMPIPWNRPILVNPVPTPINPTQIANIFMKAAFAKFMSKTGLDKKVAAIKQKINEVREKAISKLSNTKLGQKIGCPFFTKMSEKYGTGTSHPADVSAGHFYTNSTDFTIPGIIPLKFNRIYHSYSDFNSSLGVGWAHRYDMALAFDFETNQAGLRLEDGRSTLFEIPAAGESYFNRNEKLWLHHHPGGHFTISDKKGYVYRFTEKEYRNPFNRTEAHLLQSISNRNGYSLRFGYDRHGVLSQITDTAGRIFTVENDGNGHISRIIAPSPDNAGETFVIAAYEYDELNRLIKQTDALGNSMLFEYEGSLMTRETWRNGTWWEIRYDKKGTDAKCLEITGPQDLFHHRLDYVAEDCTVVTNSLGQRTTYYHNNGLVVKRIDPNGAETTFRYSPFTELEWSRDALGNTVTASYDEWGNLVNKTSADGGFMQIEYKNEQFPYLPTSATDKAGGAWAWEYDEQGNLKKRTNPMKAGTEFKYSDGLLTTITGALGQKTCLKYDIDYNLKEVLSPDEGRNRWRYDRLGRCLRYENAKNGVTEYRYNLLGDAVRIRLPDENVRELTYDAQGNIIHAKDDDRDVRFTYRGVNKLASRTERGATVRFRYNTEDRLRFVENENGERYEFKLNEQGEVIEETGFDGLTRHYFRDLAGRVQTVRRPDRTEVSYEYDETGRVTKVAYEDGTEESYEYRKDGLLTKAVNPDAEVTLERDILGRVVRETCNGETVESKYDIANRRIHIGSTLGADIEAGFNLMGDVISLSAEGWQTGYERDVFGLETGRSFAGGIRSHTGRDRLGRVTGHQIEKNNRFLSQKSYLWGTNDKLLSVITDGKETRYEYDGWGNLSKTLFEDGNVEYRNPDRSGNLFESLDRMDRKYAKGGQLIKTKDWEYRYDNSGNLVRKRNQRGEIWRYDWNGAGMLKKVTRPDNQTVTFKYDALGRRIQKSFGGNITRWVWDGNVPLHEQKETHRKQYGKEKGEYWDVTKQPVVTWVFEEGTFVPAAKLAENRKLSIATNYMGTPEAMYSSEGQKVWSCELNSYGKVRNFQGEYKTDCPFRFQGQYHDGETGLYYNRFRYYSPDEGMYISQDPIRLMGGDNLYGYVHDPNTWVDIFGLGGTGGAYMFEFASGDKYIGKGEEGRMDESIKTRTKEVQAMYPNDPDKCKIVAAASISTGGDNELGKMVENKAMYNAGFMRDENGKSQIPPEYLNDNLSGDTAWSNNEDKREDAEKLAQQLQEDLEKDRINRSCNSGG